MPLSEWLTLAGVVLGAVGAVGVLLDQARRWRRRNRVRAVGPHGNELRAALNEIRPLFEEIISSAKVTAWFRKHPHAGASVADASARSGSTPKKR